ncbi:MATE family efflux transporter [Calorimonas adulescens]|jgi:putative efflux protein, MATE family|uniref:Probable multidrug resistance protein NorM n=1 Tax=Calorimonas adulescens TaxID=2606906 RepID=A0A5D8QGP9_9THEO|nr:MATE family efflux transporter [Calorimonas adulescens]TZE82428.1 MATE family efflux transporter [Calorimonas adulescens]
MSKDKIRREVFNLAWPAIFEMVLETSVWIFDTAMVGRLSAAALSAVGLGGQLIYTLLFVLSAVGVGSAAMVARYCGAEEYDRAERVLGQSFVLSIFIGALLLTITNASVGYFFNVLVGQADVARPGITYTRIISIGGLIMVPTMVLNSALRGSGNTRVPMIATLTADLFNIFGDYVLIFGNFGFPRMGVAGAAVATTISQSLAFCVTTGYLIFNKGSIRLKMNNIINLDYAILKKLISLSIPASLFELSDSGSRLISSLWLSRLGPVAFAANQVAVSAESVSFMPGFGFSVSASTMVGQALGAKDEKKAEQAAIESAKQAVSLMSIIGLLFLTIPYQIMGFFTNIGEVRELASRCIRIGAFEQPTMALSMTLSGALKGAGDTKGPFYVSLISTWLIRLPLIFMIVFVWKKNIEYVWLVTVFQFLTEAMLMGYRFKKGGWKKIEL